MGMLGGGRGSTIPWKPAKLAFSLFIFLFTLAVRFGIERENEMIENDKHRRGDYFRLPLTKIRAGLTQRCYVQGIGLVLLPKVIPLPYFIELVLRHHGRHA